MSEPAIRRNKATTFSSATANEATFDLQHTFVFVPENVPVDGLKSIIEGGNNIRPIEVIEAGTGEGTSNEEDVVKKRVSGLVIENPELVYTHLLQLSQSYEAMATNNKLVVFDESMTVRKAFYGLIYNCTRTGLVCSSTSNRIVGVLSVSDYIMTIVKLWTFRETLDGLKGTPLTFEEFHLTQVANTPISQWKGFLSKNGIKKEFVSINASDSLYHAVEVLSTNRVHRLPVMDEDTGDCTFLLTYRRILQYIWKHCPLLPRPCYMKRTVKDLKVGRWTDIKYGKMPGSEMGALNEHARRGIQLGTSVTWSTKVMGSSEWVSLLLETNKRTKKALMKTPLLKVLDILLNGRISGMPILEQDTMKVLDVYTRFDAMSIAFFDNINLARPMDETLHLRQQLNGLHETVVTAPEDVTMWELLELFAKKNVHRIFLVDNKLALKAVVSLSDMMEYMVVRPSVERQMLRLTLSTPIHKSNSAAASSS